MILSGVPEACLTTSAVLETVGRRPIATDDVAERLEAATLSETRLFGSSSRCKRRRLESGTEAIDRSPAVPAGTRSVGAPEGGR